MEKLFVTLRSNEGHKVELDPAHIEAVTETNGNEVSLVYMVSGKVWTVNQARAQILSKIDNVVNPPA